ncbi:MAG: GHKL domain-containing protein [Lachnospiraceae bacterium]|nr:GHKL domain-containing protein [Lachnospiraceae bacterium]
MGIGEVIMEGSGLVSNLKNLIELFTFLYCLAELYGRKLKIGIHEVVFVILNLFIVTAINDFGFPSYFHSLGYITMFLYGLFYYGENMKLTLVNCFLAVIIVAFVPLFLYLTLNYLFYPPYEYINLYSLLADIGGFCLIVIYQNKVKLSRLSSFFMKRNKLILAVLLLIFCGFSINFYQIMDKRIILSETSFQMVYFVLIFLFVIYEWQKSRMDVEKKKTQLEMNKLYYEAYDQLIMLIRERQHDMKNHINAILSLSYTTKNYDELIAKQEEYCGYVIQQNEKTKLVLSSGNPLIAGFLYSKIRQAESCRIDMDYKMGIQKTETTIPEYELVEMSGILLDNAIEALSGMENENFVKKIFFSMQETESGIKIIAANTSPYYEEDLTAYFFEPGYSSKGANRGLGLSKLKKLVQNRKGTITVYNELRNDLNYLAFEIELPK